MGMKFFKLQTIPVWCFHLMSHHMSCVHIRPPPPPVETIKLIKSDGVVKIYDKPVHVSELLTEHPKHLVCKSDSFYIGQKIPPLAAGDQLQLGNNYFLLPVQYFQSVLSFVTFASMVASSSDSKNAVLKKAAACKPFDIQKSPSGILKIRVSDEFISKLIEEAAGPVTESSENDSKVCTTPQLQKDYGLLVRSKQWKPKLETIKEKEKRKISNFGIKRRKKSQSKSTQKPNHNHKSSSSLKGKIKIKLRK